MPESKVISVDERAKDEQKPFLERLLQEGARKLLQAAIENEVLDYIQFHKDRVDENGQRMVVRNGHLPARAVVCITPSAAAMRVKIVFRVSFV